MTSPLPNSSKPTQRLRTKGGEIIDLCGLSAGYRSKILEEVERGEREVVEAEPPFSRNTDKLTPPSNVEAHVSDLNFKPGAGGCNETKFPAWIEDQFSSMAEERTSKMNSNGPTYGTRAEVRAKFDAAWKLANDFLARNEEEKPKRNEEGKN